MEREHLTLSIARLREAIKRKYNQFKLGTVETEQLLERQYKPLLKELRKKSKEEVSVKEEEPEVTAVNEDEDSEELFIPGSSSSPDISSILATPDGQSSASTFISSQFTNSLTKKYMTKLFKGDVKGLDTLYGPHFDENVLKIGNKPLDFKPDGSVLVGKTIYNPTEGLYELLFMRIPDQELYDNSDLRTYKSILLQSSAHKKNYAFKANINRNNSTKYIRVIKKLFPPAVQGTGYKSVKTRDISYWDDPNELCERLALLLVSTETGNRGHANEIINIIEELKEAGFITGSGNSRYRALIK